MNAIPEISTHVPPMNNTYSFTDESLAAYVEHHVAARLAAVEALADEWEKWAHNRSTPRIDAFRDAAESLRAALHARPSEAHTQPWAGPVAALREGRVRHGLPARPDPDSSEAPA